MVTVKEWIAWPGDENTPVSIGGLGGWFTEEHTWQDYLDSCTDEAKPYAEALRESIIKEGKWITGEDHQDDDDEGTPLFSDGTIGLFSFRAWGDLMAAISQSVDGKPRSYMSWYYIYTDIPTPPTDETPTSEGEMK